MYTIAIANQKGGVGKTTTAVNLAACLAEMGRSTLLVDMDPQAQTSTCLRIEETNVSGTIFDVLLGESSAKKVLPEFTVSVGEKLDLLPSRLLSPKEEGELASGPSQNLRLKRVLNALSEKYDFCVIDCTPSLGIHTFNSLLASDAVILTIQTSFLALHGVGRILNVINRIKADYKHEPKVFALATMFDRRTRFSQDVLVDMRNYFQNGLFDTVIRNNVKLREASSFGRPINEYAPRSAGSEDYRALAMEVLKKIVRSK